MVQVVIKFQKDQISEIEVKGHADSGPKGQDLVCAGVSSICVGILNALDELSNDSCELSMDEAHVLIKSIKVCENAQIILKTMYIELLTMEKTYKKFIKITKVEV